MHITKLDHFKGFYSPPPIGWYSMSYLSSGPSWSCGSWIYDYLCNQCLSPLMLRVRILLRRGVLDILCEFFSDLRQSVASSTNNTDSHDITEILLKLALSTITIPPLFVITNHCRSVALSVWSNEVINHG